LGRASVLDGLRQSGSLKALFPRTTGGDLQAVLVNTAGGITGGDVFDTVFRAGETTRLVVTTQAAERAYKAQPGQTGTLRNHLFVGKNARISWLPQETILYNHCALSRSLTVDMEDSASLLLVEPLVFGRAAMGERLTQAQFGDRIEVRRSGETVFLDAMRLEGDVAAHLAQRHVGAGAGALTTLVYIAPDAEARLAPVRAMLPDAGGASLIGEDLLVMRLLAPDSFVLRQSLVPVLNFLTQDSLPRPWMI